MCLHKIMRDLADEASIRKQHDSADSEWMQHGESEEKPCVYYQHIHEERYMAKGKGKSKFHIHIKKLEPVRDRYMFTDNRHPEKGIMSAVLGLISVAALVCAVFFSYKNGGQALIQYAAGAFLAAIFSVAGLVLGIMSKFEKDIFKIFPNLGITLNSIAVIFVVFLLLLGFGVF